jgi:hypothetical protein
MKSKITIVACALALGTALIQPNQAAAQGKPGSVVSLADLRSQLTMLQTYISGAVGTLNKVKESGKDAAALSKAAAEYDQSYNTLQAHMDGVRSNAITIKATVKAHYDAWQKELTAVQSAKLREKAQERFSESQKEFDKIIAKATEAKEAALPFVSQLKDINIYLHADLSEEAVKTLSGDIWKMGSTSKSVNSKIEDVKEQIDRTIKSLPQK